MPNSTQICSLIVVAAVIAASAITAAAQSDVLAELERTINEEMKATGTPGAAVLVVRGDKVIYAKGFGVTSREGETGVTTDTLFRIGSTTKMFTGAAFLLLADQKKTGLRAPVSTYVSGLPSRIGRLSAHQLMSQSSGLRDMPTPVMSDDDNALARNITGWTDDAFFTEPDRIYSYSSANFWLTGLIVEKVHGKPYPDAMADLIFKPLGMTRSSVRPREAMTFPIALGHDRQGTNHSVIRPAPNNAAIYPGGSIYSSVNDISRWLIALLNGGILDGRRVLPDPVVRDLMKPQFYLPGSDPRAYYSYGLLGYEIQGVSTISHGGVSRGYGATIFFAPDQKIAYVLLTNANGQTLPRSRQKANELFLPLKKDTAEAAKTSAPVNLERYAGRYEHAPQAWEVSARDGKLFVRSEGAEHELKAAGTNEFSYPGGGILFVPNEKGEFDHIFMGLYAARKTADTK
ncbi:MAG: serine hydrolase [Chloracidobacterium sp.]|nr:serine hydrolase [Chloracidobacterium sp.]